MGREAAVQAYRDSLYDGLELDALRRVRERSTPIVGGIGTSFQQIGNALWRPFKVGGALVFGYNGGERPFPPMPEIPAAFKNTDLENDFKSSWRLKEQAAKASIESFAKLLSLDISGWWQQASIAEHAFAKDRGVLFPEEIQAAQGAALGGGFAAGVAASRDAGSSGRSVG